MKNLSKLFLVFALGIWSVNTVKAQSSLKDDKADKAAEVNKLVNNKDFVFEATHDKGSSLMYHRYDVAISKDTLVANLPGNLKPLKIATTDYAYNERLGKNGGYEIVIKPKAGVTSDVKQISMEVTPQGHASLHAVTRSHGPLSLDGYVKQEDY